MDSSRWCSGLGLASTGLAFLLYNLHVDRLGAVTASSATYLAPAVALAMGSLVAGEHVHAVDLLAAGLILSSVVALRARPDATQPAERHTHPTARQPLSTEIP